MKFLLSLIIIIASNSHASKLELVKVKSGFNVIWAIEFIGPSDLFVNERSGNAYILNLKTMSKKKVLGLPKILLKGQGGLLDITLHPNFKSNKRIYLSYSKRVNKKYTTAIGYGELKNNQLLNFKEIFVGKGNSNKRFHFGSRIVFDNQGLLYFTIGDRGQRDNAQKLDNHFGKIMRITDQGAVPKNNPFIEKKNVLPEIWSYGHRNPQGLFFDKKNNKLYEMEHGPRGGDEINIIKKGSNYGWPKVSHGKEYMLPLMVGEAKSLPGMINPYKVYIPSIAPSDLILYNGTYHPALKNSLLSGALALTHLNQVRLNDKKEIRHFKEKKLRIRALTQSSEGQLYIGADDGVIYKVKN